MKNEDLVITASQFLDAKEEESQPLTSNNKHTQKEDDTAMSIEINENTPTFDLYKGLIFMFISCIFKSTFSVLSKIVLIMNKQITSFHLLVAKTYFMFILTFILGIPLFHMKSNLIPNKSSIMKVIARSCLSVVSISILIFAVNEMSISDVFTVYYSYPAIVIILSFFLLREKVSLLDILCLFACFVGVILIIKPEFFLFLIHAKRNQEARPLMEIINPTNTTHHPTGKIKPLLNHQTAHEVNHNFIFGLVFIAALIKAVEDILIRSIKNAIQPEIFPFFYSLFGIILYPISLALFNLSLSDFNHVALTEWLLIFFIGLCSFLMQYFMAKALQNESVGRVSMVNYLQVAFMFLSDLFIFHKEMQVLDVTGTLIIFCFNFGNGLYKTFKRIVKKENLFLDNKGTKDSNI